MSDASGVFTASRRPERFYSLDVLRGVAALCVAVYHWPQIFLHAVRLGTVQYLPARLPWFGALWSLYLYGDRAVDLFFCLSGFVFYLLYSKAVAGGTMEAGRFAVLRFSRLYPLHFATLMFFALSQLILPDMSYFSWPSYQRYMFLLHLTMSSAWSWGAPRPPSFNGPSWSLSVEVLLYAVFFACTRLLGRRVLVPAALSALGFLVVSDVNSQIGRGLGAFFLGGCACLAYEQIVTGHRFDKATRAIASLAAVAWLGTALAGPHPGAPAAPGFALWLSALLFPLSILSLALLETRLGSLGRRAAFLGDISYSMYLLHYPLLVILAMVAAHYGTGSVLYAPWFLLVFLGLLVALSAGSYRWFEVPARRLLRRIGLPERAAQI